jgi:hypothetical protein
MGCPQVVGGQGWKDNRSVLSKKTDLKRKILKIKN